MTIENLTLVPFLIIFLVVYLLWFVRKENKFFTFIKDHWFYSRSKLHKASTLLYILAFIGIVLSLMDIRGPEELIKSKTANQKTILLIDTSASMMAEDVRPNRFKKAILLARHFIKNAIGQQISIIVFSDGQKRIVPFTGDVDLLDARLQALESMDLDRGGTGLSLAITEAIQYFRVSDEDMIGNILLFTDAEETEGSINIEIPDSISVGVVGIGTARGSTIPVRDRNGNLRGNKKYKGETVITKLDENFLKSMSKEITNFRYWVASSYSLPTNEILDFFNRMYKLKTSQNQFRVKPVLTHFLLIPSLCLLTLAMLLRMRNPYIALFILTFFLGGKSLTFAQDKKDAPKKTPEILKLENKFATGEMSREEKLHLAEEYYKNNFTKEANTLYSEVLPSEVNENNFNDQMNYMTTMFKTENFQEGVEKAKALKSYAQKNSLSDKEEEVKKNLLKAISTSESQSQKNKNKKDNKDNNSSKDDKNQKGNGQGKDDQGKQGQNKNNQNNKDNQGNGQDQNNQGNNNQSGQNDNKDKQDNKDNKDKNQNGDKDKNSDSGEDKNEQDKDKNNKKDKQDKSQTGDGGKRPKEVPSLLKQLVNDDNKLQKQLIDAKTQKRGDRDKKDW